MKRASFKLWIMARAMLSIVGLLLLLCLGIASKASSPEPEPLKSIGTAFTYQGRLIDANQPADGLYDFSFKLFDGPTDGNQVGITVDVNNVDVIDGYFTVELDFVCSDPNVSILALTYRKIWGSGEARWLEMGVRPTYRLMSAEPDPLPLAYTALSPRQKITPAPYALYALSGGGGSGLAAPPSSGGIYDVLRWYSSWMTPSLLSPGNAGGEDMNNLGKLDIGPLVYPGAKLHVYGTTVVSKDGIETVFGTAKRPGYRFMGAEISPVLAGIGEHMGMFGADDNELAFSTSSSEWMRINSIGNVGIGTTTPSNKLDVESGGLGQIEVRGKDSTGFGGFDIYSDSPWFGWAGVGGTASPIADIRNNFFINVGGVQPTFQSTGDEPAPAGSAGAGAGGIVFLTGGLTRAIIRNNGDVGIGTTNPGAKLEVNGQVKITGGSPGPYKVLTSDATGLASWQPAGGVSDNDWDGAGTGKMYTHFLTDNVGIGTTNPGANLDVVNMIYASNYSNNTWGTSLQFRKARGTEASPIIVNSGDETGFLYFRGYDGSTFQPAALIISYIDGTPGPADMPGRLEFKTTADGSATPTTRMTIKNDGNVGIGTTNPSNRLEVVAPDIAGARSLTVTTTNPNDGVAIRNDGSDTDADVWLNISGRKGGIVKAAYLGYCSSQDALRLAYANGFGGGTNGISIDSGGNVGIGTPTPRSILEAGSGVATFNTFPTPGSALKWGTQGIGLNLVRKSTGTWEAAGDGANNAGAAIFGAMGPEGMRFVTVESTGSGNQTFTDSQIMEKVRMVIESAGNVGIGITYPTEMLDVNGTGRFRGLTASGGTTVVADGTGKLFKQSSSRRYKTNIQNLEDDADKVLQLRPVRFQWKTSGQEEIGLIAEEVEGIAEDLVIYDQEGKPDAVKYDKVSLYLLKVVKDLKIENESLKQRLDAMEKRVDQMQPVIVKEVQQ